MRNRKQEKGLTTNVIAGTHVVFFGFDLTAAKRPGFRGFAIKRLDHEEGETVWHRGMKTFEETEPHPAKGETFSTRDHPIQSFQWADYSVYPGRKYTYTILALYGDPANLEPKVEMKINITTEVPNAPGHSAFFNRGSVATQEYARKFQNEKPSVAGPGAYDWLSRGLLEALVEFLGRAKTGWSVHGAVYEFQWHAALAAVKEAHQRGAKVKILFDDIDSAKGPRKNNRKAIEAAKIKSLCKGRANGRLMHNKFFVLSKNGKPQAVWTGSTNLTENGIFGHSNLGHVVQDKHVAQAFKDYWDRLNEDPEVGAEYRDANMEAIPVPPDPWKSGTTVVFSPRGTNLDSLEWYADVASKAKKGLFMTFAFGMHKSFKDVYMQDDDILRMALLETAVNSPKNAEQDKKDIQTLRNRPNVVVAIGNRIATNAFDRWLWEMAQVKNDVHVRWIHTKYMLVDPLGATPVVISGSANFSKASTEANDENMLVIRGDKRIADIYFGEYMRLYTHYAFREAVKWAMEKEKLGKPQDWKPQYLINNDSWMKDYFNPNDKTARFARRKYFSGSMAG